MKKFIFLCLILISSKSISAQVPAGMDGSVIVRIVEGSPFDVLREVRDASFRIFLRGGSRTMEMLPKSDGGFELSVPEGFYEIVLQTPDGRELNYQRANFYVHPDETKELRISDIEGGEEVCDSKLGIGAEPIAHRGKPSVYTPVSYDNRSLDDQYRLTIKFCGRRIIGSKAYYQYAFVTFKNLTVFATQVVFDAATTTLEAFGNVKARIDKRNCVDNSASIRIVLNDRRGAPGFRCEDLTSVSRKYRHKR